MARVVVFDLTNKAVGEFRASIDRGWMVYGNPGVDGGGQTAVDIPDHVSAQPWLQLGGMVLIEQQGLPAWAGVIDTPWKAISPVNMTLWGAEYLFSLRTPETQSLLTGSVGKILAQMIGIMNSQEEMYLALGKDKSSATSRDETLDQRKMWDQVIPLLQRSGHEMILRPERDAENRLRIYVDVGVYLGDDTGFLLDDSGPGKNMTVVDAQVDGKIINRVKGVSGSSTADDQLQTVVYEDQASQDVYRTRSEIVSFRDITQISTLQDYTKVSLASSKRPYIDLTCEVMNRGDAFLMMRPGNRVIAHSSKVRLPGGVIGWRGTGRILAMALDEKKDVIVTKLRCAL